jgi:tetratricopeptide (TPR) repeat protein
MALVEEGKFEDALKRFENAHKKRKKDPDILNMLAYTQRKLGNLEDAFKNYEKALSIQPRFPQAREYLGEAHLQAALLQIKTLRGYGKDGEKELAKLVRAFQEAAAKLQPETAGQSAPSESEREGW